MIFEFEFELTSKRKESSRKKSIKLIYFLLDIKKSKVVIIVEKNTSS
jgi:hypothetical protein